MLRNRIFVAACAVIVMFTGTLVVMGWQREAATQARYVEATLAGQRASWSALLSGRFRPMANAIDGLATDPALIRALAAGDRDAVARRLEPALAALARQGIADRIEVIDRESTLLYTSSQALFAESMLDSATLEHLSAVAGKIEGIGHDGTAGMVAAVAMPILDDAYRRIGTLTLGADVAQALKAFARGLGGEATIANRRGRVLLTTAPTLWDNLKDRGRILPGTLQGLASAGRQYELAAIPIHTFAGPGTATLIGIVDRTSIRDRQQHVDIGFLAILAAGGLLALLVLFQYIRRAFAPLDRAIVSLQALSEGDLSVPLEIEQRRDESGRIAGAIEAFREHLLIGDRLKRSREKQRRRQERLIHRQMTKLADTLEEEARAAVLHDLAEIEQAAQAAQASAMETTDGLSTAALTLEKLTGRLIDQHQKLDRLVEELREALKTKTAFIALQQELDIARKIQRSILPDSVAPRPEFAICGRMITAKEVGGDFYDFFYVAPNRLAVAIADVSGKGVPAAFFMAIARTMLKAIALLTDRPGDCVRKLNDLLSADDNQGMFVTLVYGVLDLDSGRFTYVNAGHNAPVLIGADGTVAPLDYTQGMALAVLDGQAYAEREITLAPGDSLFLYTDGITEAMNTDGALFTEDRLIDCLREQGDTPVDEVADHVIAAVKQFEDEADQADDISCVVLRLRGTGKTLALTAA